MKPRRTFVLSALWLLAIALPAAADGLRLRLELWEVPAKELAQRMDAEEPGETWLAAFRKDALTGKLSEVKLLTSAALAVREDVTVSQRSGAEEIYASEYEPPQLPPSPSSSGEPFRKTPGHSGEKFIVPSIFETRNTGQDLTVGITSIDGGAWEVSLTGSITVLHGMRGWGNPVLNVSLPVFDVMKLEKHVTAPLSQWRILSAGAVSSAVPAGFVGTALAAGAQQADASRQMRRLLLFRLEPNE